MSLIVFPFKVEDPSVVINDVKIAASHQKVREVLCVGAGEESTFAAIQDAAPDIQSETGVKVSVIVQERIGNKRSGKGDGMNTALKYFINNTDHQRIHFYDADITSFGANWITKAEDAADYGFGVVRHYFPRARTDGMITQMVTKVGFALLWPNSGLSWIEQPLGGELLFTRPVVEKLISDERVMNQSDWGIDTLYTFSTLQHGFKLYESYMAEGKAHKLYGKLTDIRTMLIECFSAIQSLKNEKVDQDVVHRMETPNEVPSSITEKLGFDFEGTMQLLISNWTEKQEEYLQLFPASVKSSFLENKRIPSFSFMTENTWKDTYFTFIEHFVKGDPDWEELLFKLWLSRVLHFTTQVAIRGYDFSQRYLHDMVHRYRMHEAQKGQSKM